MSDEDDDYLSDKFLERISSPAVTSSSSKPKTYSEIRKEALKKATLKNEQNRRKSHKERREEGLRTSLFDKAKEEGESSSGNKALSIMMKMGFKPGQSLGATADEDDGNQGPPSESDKQPEKASALLLPSSSSTPLPATTHHKTEPLPLNEWEGRRGIGIKRRPPSPAASERVAKMAKMAEHSSRLDFRDRTRAVYEERRAEGRLAPAQRTCAALDETAGKSFNVLLLNPKDPESFPPGLLDALALYTTTPVPVAVGNKDEAALLREQMRSDALRPLHDQEDEDEGHDATLVDPARTFSPDILEETAQFLRLQARDRLELVLGYLRERYLYCFWCGTRYDDEEDMKSQCPGPNEEDHD